MAQHETHQDGAHQAESHHDDSHRVEWRARALECRDFAMEAQEAGAGAPTLCLGFADPASCRLLDDLARGLHLIALAPAALPLDGAPALESADLARHALTCADSLGHGLFAIVARGDEDHAALRLALLAPQRVSALALLAPDLHSHDGPAGDADLLDAIAHLRAPALAAFGALDRAAARNARLLRERLPHCRIALLRDAGEEVERERPHALARMIAAFLRAPHAFSTFDDPAWSHGFPS